MNEKPIKNSHNLTSFSIEILTKLSTIFVDTNIVQFFIFFLIKALKLEPDLSEHYSKKLVINSELANLM